MFIREKRLGAGGALGKSAAKTTDPGDFSMAANKADHTATEMDYPAHERNYAGFMTMVKWSIGVIAVIVAVVLLIIAN